MKAALRLGTGAALAYLVAVVILAIVGVVVFQLTGH
jgi:hypothetical protein